jgi:hypothetical protein
LLAEVEVELVVSDVQEAQHFDPVWRDQANFIIATAIEPIGSVTTEQLWARRVDDYDFELCCIPFFTYGLALGDVVRTGPDFMVEKLVRPSGRFVFRADFGRTSHQHAEKVADQLVQMGALLEWWSATLIAVDGRDEAHAWDVGKLLRDEQALGNLAYEPGG